jgi:hypothetical protein
MPLSLNICLPFIHSNIFAKIPALKKESSEEEPPFFLEEDEASHKKKKTKENLII